MVSVQNLGSSRQRACRAKLRVVEYRVFAFFSPVTRCSRGLVVSTLSAQCERTTHVQVLSYTPLFSTVKVYPSPSSGAPPIPPIHVFHSPNTQDIPPPS